jgi:anti-sigma regulatory factor (Ser/Thr protein kinase)
LAYCEGAILGKMMSVAVPKGHAGPMSVTLQPGLQACPAARRFVYYAADQWLGQERLADVLTVVTELVANATTHARTPMVLNLASRGGRIRVELYDESPALPARREGQGIDAGLGLRIVEGVALRWGVNLRDDGKVVWAEV